MSKRPLCLAALLLLFVLWLLPEELFWRKLMQPSGSLVTVTGTVAKREEKNGRQILYLKHSNLADARIIQVSVPGEQSYFIGNSLLITGKIYQAEEPGNPGQFHARRYYQTLGIDYTMQADEVKVTNNQTDPLAEGLLFVRSRLQAVYDGLMCPRDSGLLNAMVLGEKQTLDGEIKELYQKNGMAHILAISGLHISILGMNLYRLLRRLGGSFAGAGIPSGIFIVLYGVMTGFGVSTVRAVCMFLLSLGAEILGRNYDLLTALGAAGILLLLEQPLYARHAGFLLSFGAVLGIGLVLPVLEWQWRERYPCSRFFLPGLSVQIFTLPILLVFYYEFPVYSLLLNSLVIPMMTAVMLAGVLGGLLGLFVPFLGRICFFFCHQAFSLQVFLAEITGRLPGAVFASGCPGLWQLIVYYGGLVLLLIWQYWRMEQGCKKKKRGAFLSLLLVLTLALLYRNPKGLTITMLDVGQGDGIFLQTPEVNVLIDGGSTDVKGVGAYRLVPFLKHQGVGRLDLVLLSHLDNDHISGVKELLTEEWGEVEIGTLLLPRVSVKDEAYEEMEALAKEAGVPVQYMGRGDALTAGKLRLLCLQPSAALTTTDRNENSMILSLHYGAFSMLFTGDVGPEGEEQLLREGTLLSPYDVLKVAHHGSRFSTSEEWLQAVKPGLALISAGEGNSYGHPHQEVLERLAAAGIKTISTREAGAVTLWTDGEQLRFHLFRD